jgi:hypothetical protein
LSVEIRVFLEVTETLLGTHSASSDSCRSVRLLLATPDFGGREIFRDEKPTALEIVAPAASDGQRRASDLP